MSTVHFGVTLPQIKRPWQDTRATAVELEPLGSDSLWFNDHLYGGIAKIEDPVALAFSEDTRRLPRLTAEELDDQRCTTLLPAFRPARTSAPL